MTRVEVTLDGGETWQVCALDHPEKPSRYGKFWCWCFWSLEVEVLHLLGGKEIAVRAWDESLNTQPEKLIWNLMVRLMSNLTCDIFLGLCPYLCVVGAIRGLSVCRPDVGCSTQGGKSISRGWKRAEL